MRLDKNEVILSTIEYFKMTENLGIKLKFIDENITVVTPIPDNNTSNWYEDYNYKNYTGIIYKGQVITTRQLYTLLAIINSEDIPQNFSSSVMYFENGKGYQHVPQLDGQIKEILAYIDYLKQTKDWRHGK